MVKAEFLQETREGFEGGSLHNLEYEINYYLTFLTQGELDPDERVHDDLLNLLALRLFHAEKMVEGAADNYQRKTYEALVERYTAFFRNPSATDGWVYTYCVDQVDYYVSLGEEEKAKRWGEIVVAMTRFIRGETALDKQIAVEIAEREVDVRFLPDEWRRLRKEETLEPTEIGYDLCHMLPG